MDYKKKLEELLNAKNNIENEIENTIEELRKRDELDFETWYKSPEKTNHKWLLPESAEVPYIRSYAKMQDRYKTILLDDILEYYEECDEELELVKRELIKSNFGSMIVDW